MNQKNILIVLINFNGEKFLQSCLESLTNQEYSAKKIVVIDNGSSDKSLEIIRTFSDVEIIINEVNNGYAGAADQACHLAKERKAEYVMLLNPDIVFENNYISTCIDCFKRHSKTASVQGKLLKYNFDTQEKTTIIDSTGLYSFKNRRIIDRGQGREDVGQYDSEEPVFGITGACPIYCMNALEEIKIDLGNNDYEYFDRDFFMYKEDIDISWRFLLAGYQNIYCPTALAYHGRGTGVLKRYTHREVMKSRKDLPRFTKYYSYKNQRLMQLKNEIPSNVFSAILPIAIKEAAISGYIMLREPHLIASWWKMMKQLPKTLKKRKQIQRLRKEKKVSAKDMAHWFEGSGTP